jgi:hypothetical protein
MATALSVQTIYCSIHPDNKLTTEPRRVKLVLKNDRNIKMERNTVSRACVSFKLKLLLRSTGCSLHADVNETRLVLQASTMHSSNFDFFRIK